MTKNSISLVSGHARLPSSVMKRRKDLEVGDVFKLVGDGYKNLYMHTGQRTAPPSGVTVDVNVNGTNIPVVAYKSLGTNAAGKHIIGYQSIIVQGQVKASEDGSVVSFDGSKQVQVVGKANITLALFG